jgi:hypothetical protein
MNYKNKPTTCNLGKTRSKFFKKRYATVVV